jgi:hypothetical protein
MPLSLPGLSQGNEFDLCDRCRRSSLCDWLWQYDIRGWLLWSAYGLGTGSLAKIAHFANSLQMGRDLNLSSSPGVCG